jgi:hypothetical protein
MEMYKQLAKLMLATEASPLVLGNVEFWIDATGPWAGVLSFSIPTGRWDVLAIAQSVSDLCRVYPEVARIVNSFCEVKA